jgi:hypothetical protein
MYRHYRSLQFTLIRTVLQAPRLLMALSITCSFAAVVTAFLATQGAGLGHGAAVVLALVGTGLSLQVWRIAGRRGLRSRQREMLLQALGRTAPLEVRVSAIDHRDAIRYARDLRSVMTEAKWPVAGVFKVKDGHGSRELALAVRNVVAPPSEAIALMNALRRVGLPAIWHHKPDLKSDRTIEVLIGRLR